MSIRYGNQLISGTSQGVINQPFYVYPTAGYTMTGSWANVTGHSIILPEAGTYRVVFDGIVGVRDDNSNDAASSLRLHDGTSVISGTARRYRFQEQTNRTSEWRHYIQYHIEKIITVTTSTTITLQGHMAAGDVNAVVDYIVNEIEPYCMYQKLGLEDASLLQKTKYQFKKLASNKMTSGGGSQALTDLSFSNLEVGKTYKLTAQASMTVHGTSATEYVGVSWNTPPVDLYLLNRADTGPDVIVQVTGSSIIFTATATTLNATGIFGGANDNTLGAASTFAILEELTNHEPVTTW